MFFNYTFFRLTSKLYFTGDHYVTRSEFLHDDLSLQSLMLTEIKEHLGDSVIEWIEESRQISMICISPENCWYQGDATDKKKKL